MSSIAENSTVPQTTEIWDHLKRNAG